MFSTLQALVLQVLKSAAITLAVLPFAFASAKATNFQNQQLRSHAVDIFTTMTDEITGAPVFSRGVGTLVSIDGAKFVLTVAHVTQGKNLALSYRGRNLELDNSRRAADSYNDLEIIGVKTDLEEEFSYDWSVGAFVRNLREDEFFSAVPLTAPRSVQLIQMYFNRLNNPNVLIPGCRRPLQGVSNLETGLIGLENRSSQRIQPGNSGTPILGLEVGAATDPQSQTQVVIMGVAKQYSRFFSLSYYVSALAIKRFVENFVSPVRPVVNAPEVTWHLRNGLTYRRYADGSSDYLFHEFSQNANPDGRRNPSGSFREGARGGIRGDGGDVSRAPSRGGIRGDGGDGRSESRGGIRGDGGDALRAETRGGIRGDGGETRAKINDHLYAEHNTGTTAETGLNYYRIVEFPAPENCSNSPRTIPDPWSAFGIIPAMNWKGTAARSLGWRPTTNGPRYWLQANPQALHLSYQVPELHSAHFTIVSPRYSEALGHQLEERLPSAQHQIFDRCEISYDHTTELYELIAYPQNISYPRALTSGTAPPRLKIALDRNGVVQSPSSATRPNTDAIPATAYRPIFTSILEFSSVRVLVDISGLFAADISELNPEDFAAAANGGRVPRILNQAHLDIAPAHTGTPERIYCRRGNRHTIMSTSQPR